jgi:hypothetical protein
MNKLIIATAIVSIAYFSYMKYFTTHSMDEADFIIMVFITMIFGAWMIAALVVASESPEHNDNHL